MQQRQDIQALRGIAISLVLLDHARIPWFEGGFLGVDIFFVISGFLITGSIHQSLQDGRFRFRDFYFKRARRILPAALITVAATALGAIWFMSSLEMISLEDQVRGALTFTINFVLAKQVDYFGVDSNSKPLLHMWSLAVEEQFYLLLPVIMVLTPRRARRAMLVVLTAVSFGLCLRWVRSDAVAAFYMLPSRAWELGIGGCAAVFAGQLPRMPWAVWPALAALAVLPFAFAEFQHPGWVAAALCVATATVILADNPRFARSLPARGLASIGDISYSLYLVHWPVMVFAHGAFLGTPPAYVGAINIALSLGLAVALYRGVERPVIARLRVPAWSVFAGCVVATLAAALISMASISIAKPRHDWATLRAPNHGFEAACDYSGQRFVPKPQCQNDADPSVMVWGDSYAMHLVPGIAARDKVVQATFSVCAPFVGHAPKRSNVRNPVRWAQRCLAFSNDVLAYLETQASIRTVVLSSPWRSWVAPQTVWSSTDGKHLDKHVSSTQFALDAIAATIQPLKAMGKRVVLVGPPPSNGGDPSACLERKIERKVLFAGDCTIDSAAAARYDAAVNEFLDRAAARYGVDVIRISDALCRGERCITDRDGVPIYRDSGHLSQAGSRIVFELLRAAGKLTAIDGGDDGASVSRR